MAQAARVGIIVDLDAITTDPLAVDLCRVFGLDPLGTIASGALLATAKPENVSPLLQLWTSLGWVGREIGQITPTAGSHVATRKKQIVDLPRFAVDEITKLWP